MIIFFNQHRITFNLAILNYHRDNTILIYNYHLDIL